MYAVAQKKYVYIYDLNGVELQYVLVSLVVGRLPSLPVLVSSSPPAASSSSISTQRTWSFFHIITSSPQSAMPAI
jgi:hypothetical protein